MSDVPIPAVFIPALLCDDALYSDVIERLSPSLSARVLLSPKPSLEESAADILARAPERFVLIGTSYGGNLALEIALGAPERVIALWLMGCNPGLPQAGGPDLAGGLTATPDAVIDMLAGLVVHQDHAEAIAAFRAMAHRVGGKAGAAQAHALGIRKDALSRLGSLTMPAMVLWGAEDALVPQAVGRKLADALPHAHFYTLARCGHLPTLEQPEQSAARFADFLGNELHHAA